MALSLSHWAIQSINQSISQLTNQPLTALFFSPRLTVVFQIFNDRLRNVYVIMAETTQPIDNHNQPYPSISHPSSLTVLHPSISIDFPTHPYSSISHPFIPIDFPPIHTHRFSTHSYQSISPPIPTHRFSTHSYQSISPPIRTHRFSTHPHPSISNPSISIHSPPILSPIYP